MFALGFLVREEDGYEKTEWSVEFVTDDIGEAIDNLFEARNFAAEGSELSPRWQGAQLMIGVLHGDKIVWEMLDDGSRVE